MRKDKDTEVAYSVKADRSGGLRRRIETDRRTGCLVNFEADSVRESASLTSSAF